VSLARTAGWLDALGRAHDGPGEAAYPHDLVDTMDSPFGRIGYVRPPGRLDGYTPLYAAPPHRPGADPPVWDG